MTGEQQAQPHVLRVADLPQRGTRRFDLAPGSDICAALARDLDLTSLRKLSFRGAISPEGKADFRLDAQLGATVVQPCVVTMEPVTTRIDEAVLRRFLHDWHAPDDRDEIEMPEDDSTEPLPAEIDLIAVLREALALALPDYPRAPGAALAQTDFAADGVTPLSDEDVKPFAALSALKQKLDDPGS